MPQITLDMEHPENMQKQIDEKMRDFQRSMDGKNIKGRDDAKMRKALEDQVKMVQDALKGKKIETDDDKDNKDDGKKDEIIENCPVCFKQFDKLELKKHVSQCKKQQDIENQKQEQIFKQITSEYEQKFNKQEKEINKQSNKEQQKQQKANKRLCIFRMINDDLRSQDLQKIENICIYLNKTFRQVEDERGRNLLDQSGIVDILLQIYATCDLKTINRHFTQVFNSITHPSASLVFRKQLYRENIYQSLLRLFDHEDYIVAVDGIVSIFHILLPGAIESKEIGIHPHFQELKQIGAIPKIYNLFKDSEGKPSKDFAAVCLGMIYRSQAIEDKKMKSDVIDFLKSRLELQGN
ncbi:MAG: hypothetical protein EZS28_046942, partial [Streblomastix strix]